MAGMYEWRKLNEKQRMQILASRRKNLRPWHSPPHFDSDGAHTFHLSAACYEHRPIIGVSASRMEEFETELVEILSAENHSLYAWCVLPNHWHGLIHTVDLKGTISEIGKLHGRTSFLWNQDDGTGGRKCWHRCADRRIRSDRHFHVARNYIHHNPVKHGYVEKWEDWPYASAGEYISIVGRDVVLKQWQEYPVLEMGDGWDD